MEENMNKNKNTNKVGRETGICGRGGETGQVRENVVLWLHACSKAELEATVFSSSTSSYSSP
jgi:hypothetical protein